MFFFLFTVKPGGDRDVFLSIKDVSVPLIHQGPPIMCKFASVLPTGASQSSHNKADKFTVRSTSLRHDTPPPPLRSAKRPTHHTMEELKTL